MEALSHTITPKLTPTPVKNDVLRRNGFTPAILRSNGCYSTRICRRSRVFAKIHHSKGLNFNDPDWKLKFQRDFEDRFDLPHITDIFKDATPIPSTFCLRMRTPVNEEFADGYPSDEKWHGYINNKDRVLLKVINYSSPNSAGAECIDPDCTWVEQWVHRAGPREEIYFRPEEVKAAIVTCGGLCPGLNDVIRHIVITLEIYGVKNIVGIPFGYRGFCSKDLSGMPLSRKVVQNIHLSGGSLLGVSRGGPGVSEIVDSMEERGINMLFVLGGNGTHAGANAIHNECRKRRMKVAVVGVPKTIDNDILLMDKTFGFDTAVEEAQRAINSAYIEAHSAYHGIGVVKLMGRSSGFIAMHAALASGQIDICLIPEVPFSLHGPHGVLRHLKYLIDTKGSAVICVAEGAGQNLIEKTNATDASGNIVLGDIGVHIQQETKKYFKKLGVPADVKYIDPTYMIRACRANASDGILCTVLGQNAVHGAFAGFSGITVGICNTHYAYFPIPEVISYPRAVDPNSRMWHRCLTSTGQPDFV
ncbi:ATP-dependent 6-phosphofructokinase 5, chloroplastic isoform X2 [Pistacia vera]|uniref:ATP-dependent 6-phosphofructokinase 5, chloroplastic isoform X1 n=1 Tax=Pistacia vera TaxID=55513 RepID=UPI0012631A06|nr:ATP-dependent 6-phosphofructokinase 5, chloroplastic isoform X1 [Pistacia vera]XP_031285413.1 ATP-dependent 6-phosphofructokinase 5, chloroplastic isoform X2 [Pistacia vera]